LRILLTNNWFGSVLGFQKTHPVTLNKTYQQPKEALAALTTNQTSEQLL
jgi:hypothetical protein